MIIGLSCYDNLLVVAYMNVASLLLTHQQGNDITGAAQNWYRKAFEIAPNNDVVRWHWGHTFLVSQQYTKAVTVLSPLQPKASTNAFFYADLVRALSLSEAHESVIRLYENGAPVGVSGNEELNDLVALAYLTRMQEIDSASNSKTQFHQDLEKAIVLRPYDLWLNYYLLEEIRSKSNAASSVTEIEVLKNFKTNSINPTDMRLLTFGVSVIPKLAEQNIWDKKLLTNVIAYLVWQKYTLPKVEELLVHLGEIYSTDPLWPYYLGELYSRRNETQKAIAAYKGAVDLNYPPAYLRLGMAFEEVCFSQEDDCPQNEDTVQWYKMYYQLAPQDIIGLVRLRKIYNRLGNSEAARIEALLEEEINNSDVVSKILKMPLEDIELGPNLLQNGDLEIWTNDDSPVHWLKDYQPRNQNSIALFITGADALFSVRGNHAARVLGLWLDNQENNSTTRVGYWYGKGEAEPIFPVVIEPSEIGMLSFLYRTDGKVKVWMNNLFFQGDYSLPETNGQFWKVVIIGKNKTMRSVELTPVIRTYSTGEFLLDEVQLRKLKTLKKPKFEKTFFWLSSAQ